MGFSGSALFLGSKFFSAITQPLSWVACCGLVALFLIRRRPRMAIALMWGALGAMGLLGFQALPDALLRPLESRYSAPASDQWARHVGVIVLGGALGHPSSFIAHGQVPLGDAAERMTVPVALLRQHPRWDLVFSGGEGRLWTTGVAESVLAQAFYQEQGVNMARVLFEQGSRNTHENARQVAKLLGERCQQPWLLVTSAWHMPRAMAEFEAVACQVTPYPVDFRTGHHTAWNEYALAPSLLRWQIALHEWLGLWVLAWRSDR